MAEVNPFLQFVEPQQAEAQVDEPDVTVNITEEGGADAPPSQPSEEGFLQSMGRGAVAGVRGAGQSMLDLSADVAETVLPESMVDPGSEPLQLPEVTQPERLPGKLTQGIVQFATAFLPAGRVLKAFGWAKGGLPRAAARGGLADFAAFGESEARFSNLLTEIDNPLVNNAVTQYLASDEDDGWAEGRFKNVLEGAGLGVATEGIFRSLRAFRRAKTAEAQGGPEAAAKVLHEEAPGIEEALTIKSAAVKIDDRIYEGVNHLKALDLLEKTEGLESLSGRDKDIQSGFTTSTGEFVSRKEAADIKGKEGLLSSRDLETDTLTREQANRAAVSGARRNVALERTKADETAGETREFYNLIESDEKVGGIDVVIKGDKATIEGIFLQDTLDTPENFFGPGVMRQLGRQFKELHPEINTLTGSRETGARFGKAASDPGRQAPDISIPMPKLTREQADQAVGKTRAMLGDKSIDPAEFGMSADDFKEMAKRIRKAKAGKMGWDEALSELPLRSDGDALTFDNAKVLIQNISEEIRKNAKGLWDEPQTVRAMRDVAEKMQGDPKSIISAMSQLGAQRDEIGALVLAARGVQQALTRTAMRSARAAQQDPSKKDIALGWVNLTAQLTAGIRETGGLGGRILRFLQEPIGPRAGVATQRKFGEFFEQLQMTGDIDGFLGKIAKMDDPEVVENSLWWAIKNRGWDVPNEYWINAILSGPKTHAVNITSNLIKGLIRPTSDALGHLAQGQGKKAIDDLSNYGGLAMYLVDSVKAASVALKNEEVALDPLRTTVETANMKAIPGPLGTFIRLPTRALLVEDEFFKHINYRAKLHSISVRDGRNAGLKGDELSEYVADRMVKGFDENGRGTNPIALQYARENTFTSELEYGLGQWIQTGLAQHPGLRQIIPFVRTPTNLFREAWRHLPGVGLLEKRHRDALLRSNNPDELAQLMGKQMVGSVFVGSAVAFAVSGRMTGGGPKDPTLRKAWLREYQPYSVKMGDQWHSFARLDPFGSLFGIVGDFVEISGSLTPEDAEELSTGLMWAFIGDVMEGDQEAVGRLQEGVGQGFMAAIKNATSKTYMQGMADFIGMVASDEEWQYKRWIYNKIGSFIPNAFRQTNPDQHIREVRGVLDAMMARIPGFSEMLEPQFDFMGKPIIRNDGPVDRALSPIASIEKPGHPVWSELLRLGQSFPPVAERTKGVDLLSFTNRDGKTAYRRLNEIIEGLDLEGRLNTLIKNPASQKLSDNQDLTDVNYEGSKVGQLKLIVQQVRDIAFQKLLTEELVSNRPGKSGEAPMTLFQAFINHRRNKEAAKAGIEALPIR